MRGVLRLAPFRRLLAAYTLNELAWSFSSLALSYLIYRGSGSALGAAAFYQGTLFVPALVAPLFVARIDRRHPRSTLPVLYGLQAIAYFVLALVARHSSWVVVLAIATVTGIIALIGRSLARAATVAVTSPAGLLREGNALANTMFTVCFMAGPVIAGLVIVAGGTTAVLLINGGLFVVITAVLATAGGLPAPAAAEATSWWRRLHAAVDHVCRDRVLRSLFILQSVLLVFFTISIPVEVVYAEHTLHAGAAGYGVLISAWGGGAVAGSTIYARWRRLPARELIVLGSVLLGVGLLLMAVAPTLPVAIAGSAIAGVGNGIYAVSARTAVQEAVEAAWMPLMMSFNEAISQAIPGVGILIGGLVAALASTRSAFAVGGIGALSLTGVAWLMLRPAVRVSRPHIEGPAHDQV